MYTEILVGLDGSAFAEQVLRHVEALAEKFDAEVVLVRASTPPEALITESAPGVLATGTAVDPVPLVEDEREEASRYLEGVAQRLRGRGLSVAYEQPEGPAATVIVERARHLQADLIAMTTHGRGGLGRLVFGSVADEVLRNAPCPVLLVRVSEATAS